MLEHFGDILANINYLAVLVALIFNQFFGGMWYGPIMGKAWMQEMDVTEADISKEDATKSIIKAVILGAFIAVIIAIFASGRGAVDGAFIGFLMAAASSLMTMTNHTFEMRSQKHTMITIAYPLISWTIMGLIIGVWK